MLIMMKINNKMSEFNQRVKGKKVIIERVAL